MRIFLDERCLNAPNVAPTLHCWRQIADRARDNAVGIQLFLDRQVVRSADFLRRFNEIRKDERRLYVAMLFGAEYVLDWRPVAIAAGAICKIATDINSVEDSGVCETYEHRKQSATIAIIGDEWSSFAGREIVTLEKIAPPEPAIEVACGTAAGDFQRIGEAWNVFPLTYDARLSRPPRDYETVLGHRTERFRRTGRFERSGRRNVFEELTSGRLYYVDNLHYGVASHLEVFDSEGLHIGTADLEGHVNVAGVVPGRRILW